MASYKLVFKHSVAQDLRSIPNTDATKILVRIEKLAENPRPIGARKLTRQEKYRLRQGSYRILYTIEEEVVTVTVVKGGQHRDVYR